MAEAAWAHARWPLLLWASSYVLAGLLPALQVAWTAMLLDRLLRVAGHGMAGLAAVLPPAAGLAAAGLATQTLYFLWPEGKELCAMRLQRGLDAPLLQHLGTAALATREDPEVDPLLQRAGAPGRQAADLLELSLNALMDGCTVVSLGLVLGGARWWLPVGLVAGAIPAVVVAARGAGAVSALDRAQALDIRLAAQLAALASDREAAAEVRLYGLAEDLIARWHALTVRLARERSALIARASVRTLAAEVLPRACTLAGIVALIALARTGSLPAGRTVALVGGVVALVGALDGFARRTGPLREGADRLADIARLRSLVSVPAPAGTLPFPRPLRSGLVVDDVVFRYPGAEHPALSGVRLRLRPGEHLALVGPNGAGKSTLAKCLLGLYAPQQGRITVDGRDLAAIAPDSLRAAVAPVFQDYLRPEFTVREAMALDRPGLDDVERLRPAAAAAGAAAWISSLPRGYETPLGRSLYDDGVEPSGGQWQRLALARGLAGNPEVLILDEPAAAQDPRAEAALYARFREVARGRTIVLISHRLGSARLADRVAVLAAGRIVEEGSHEELLRQGGLYAAMWAAQAAWYREAAGAASGEAP